MLAVLALAAGPAAAADTGDAALRKEVKALEERVRLLEQRVGSLEGRSQHAPEAKPTAQAPPPAPPPAYYPPVTATPAAPAANVATPPAIVAAPAANATTPPAGYLTPEAALRVSWSKVRQGIGEREVVDLLGQPSRKMTLDGRTVWYYVYPGTGRGSIFFTDAGRVSSSQSPFGLGW